MSESLNRKAVFIAPLEVANAKGGAWLKQKAMRLLYDFAVMLSLKHKAFIPKLIVVMGA